MSTQEFYIRGESDTEARGPFTQDQLASLVEAQQLTPETLYYDAAIEQWVPVSSNASLLAALFPEKKRLKVRPKDDIETLNVQNATDAPIRVEDMLAAAEGRTPDTTGKGDPKLTAERVSSVGRYAIILMLALSVFAMWFAPVPGSTTESGLHLLFDPVHRWRELLTNPFIIAGVVDLFFFIVLLLGATAFYPVIRLRALAALGFFGLICFLNGNFIPLIAVVAGSAGMYMATLAISWPPLAPAILLGVGGMAGLAYLRVFL